MQFSRRIENADFPRRDSRGELLRTCGYEAHALGHLVFIMSALVKCHTNQSVLKPAPPQRPKQSPEIRPLSDEMVDELLGGRGFHGWLRAARVARVLGLFSLYLFLDTYDVRADFNRRAVARLREQVRERGRKARLQARSWAAGDVLVA